MKNLIKIFTFLMVVIALIFIPIIIYYVSLLQEKDRIKEHVLSLSAIIKPQEAKNSRLKEITDKHFLIHGQDYAVVIKNLKTDEEYKFNENKKYDSASLYKLWVMGVAFEKIKDGTMDEDQSLSAVVEILDKTLSTATPTPTPEGYSITPTPGEVKKISMITSEAIEKMITYSDNYAALLVASRAGTFSVTNFLKKYEFKDSNFRQPPKTSANDIALFYELLYEGEIVDRDYSVRMMDLLKKQTLNDRIPKYLPNDVEVAHKTGELFNSKHDAGIVFSKKGDYIIVVLSETKNSQIAAEKIANYSKEIYNYFQEN